MTESDWNTITEPQTMVDWLHRRGKLSARKARLFAGACCRRVWHLLTDERSRRAIEVAEAFADDSARAEELTAAYYAANVALLATDPTDECVYAAASLACAVAYVLPLHGCSCTPPAGDAAADTVADASQDAIAYRTAKIEECAIQCRLLRDIVSNPFRPPHSLDSRLLTPNAVGPAHRTYDERKLPEGAFDHERLAVLADALEEVGCTDTEFFAHLRSPGPHVRGCFALDALLGKS